MLADLFIVAADDIWTSEKIEYPIEPSAIVCKAPRHRLIGYSLEVLQNWTRHEVANLSYIPVESTAA